VIFSAAGEAPAARGDAVTTIEIWRDERVSGARGGEWVWGVRA
jgi:hypothetical protein